MAPEDRRILPERMIDANPTKAFFIEMLTRDIKLIPAIVDLVDNCVDGATEMRGDKPFGGLWVRLQISDKMLLIADNCGGIEVEIAEKYAFRFGRPGRAPSIAHSIGRFGVGMKRAFFKIGKRFRVESQAETSRFVVEESVTEWAKKEEWKFEFDQVEEKMKKVPADKRGTKIILKELHDDVAEEFAQPNFQKALDSAIKSRLQNALSRGLAITLNGIPIGQEPLELLSGRQIAPAFKEIVYRKLGKPVAVKLYCGLGESDPAMAGWHVFCNGRLVLEADKSGVTGWGEKHETRVPTYHPQFNSFRGYAYFDSDDAGRLPWNTTKTGMDTDSPVYRAVRPEMMKMMRPVIDFLNRLKEEKEGKSEADEKGPLETLVESAASKPVEDVETRPVFELPRVREQPKPRGPVLQGIQYNKPLEEVKKVMRIMKVNTYKKVGEKTFEYYYNAECQE
jgi:hypothetical protein